MASATALNQNDIVKIIKSNINSMNDITETLVKGANPKKMWMEEKFVENVRRYTNVLSTVFGEKGPIQLAIGIMSNLDNKLKSVKPIGILMWLRIKRLFRGMSMILQELANFMGIGTYLSVIGSRLNLAVLGNIFLDFSGIIDTIHNIKISVKDFIKIRLARSMIKRVLGIFNHINDLMLSINIIAVWINLQELRIVLNTFVSILDIINKLKIQVGTARKIKRLTKIIQNIRFLFIQLNSLRVRKSVVFKILLIEIVFKNLAKALLSLLLLVPIMLLVTLFAPGIIIGFLALRILISVISRICLGLVANGGVILGILVLGGIITALTLVGGSLLIMMMMAVVIVAGLKSLLLYFAGLIAIFLMIAVIGSIVALMTPILGISIVGLTLMVGVLTMFTLIGVELLLIQLFKFDEAKIRRNIQAILGVAKNIINIMFGEDEVGASSNQGKGPLNKLFRAFMKGTGMIVESLLASAFFVSTFVSVTLMTLIALQLILLGAIRLNPASILGNVNLILGVARSITEILFGGNKEEVAQYKPKTWMSGIIGRVFAGVGTVIEAMLASAYLALTFVSIAMITFIALMLKGLQNIKLDTNGIKTNVGTVLGCATDIIDGLFNYKDTKEDSQPKSWFMSIINFVSPELSSILQSILAVAFLSMTVISIGLIMLISKQLSKIQDLNLDYDKIHTNVTAVVSACKEVISSITQQDKTETTEGKGFLRKLLKMVLPDTMFDIIDGIMAMGFLAMALVCIKLVSNIAGHLTTIQNTPSMNGIADKTRTIIGAAHEVITAVTNEEKLPNITESYVNGFENLIKLTTQINQLGDQFTKMSKFDKDQILKGRYISEQIVDMVSGVANVVDKSGITNSIQLLNKYESFLTKINNIDLTKLQQTTSMFEQMARFSESISGNFEGLAESLNEKISPLLEELKELISNLPNAFDQTGTKMSDSINSAIGSAADAFNGVQKSRSQIEQEVQKQHPDLSKEEVEQIATQVVNKQLNASTTTIAGAIAEIKNILKSSGVKVQGRI